MAFRILPHEFRAKASAEGPCGNRALPLEPFNEETQPPSQPPLR
jgi:hypothetical protein